MLRISVALNQSSPIFVRPKPRRSSRRSSRVAWTIATHCCSASATDFDGCSRYRTLPPAWSQAPVGVTTSHQCYGSCTGCQSVSALCSRSQGSYISRLLERLPRTPHTTVAFCRTWVVAHCGSIPMTCGSCLCNEHIPKSVIGVSRPPILDCKTTFHLDSGGRYLPLTPSNNL